MPKVFDVYQLPHFRKCLFWNFLSTVLIATPTTLFLVGLPFAAFERFLVIAIPLGIGIFVTYPLAYRWLMQAIANETISDKVAVKIGVKTAIMLAFMTLPLYAIFAVVFQQFEFSINPNSYFYTHPLLLRVALIGSIIITSPILGMISVIFSILAIVPLGGIFGAANYYALKNTPKATIDQALKLTETSPS